MPKRESISELDDHLGYWLRFVSNHVSHAFKLKVEARGVTVAEWVVLRELLRLGPCNPSQVADGLGMTRGAISKLIQRLGEKQLVARSMSDGDRRFQFVELTAAGKRLVPTLARLADENDREFFGQLPTKERAALVAVLQGLVQRHGWKEAPVD